MKPVHFREATVLFAADQPEYLPLPAHRDAQGGVTSCWSLTWGERLKVLLFGRLWITTLTFGAPLQPILPRVEWPPCDQVHE